MKNLPAFPYPTPTGMGLLPRSRCWSFRCWTSSSVCGVEETMGRRATQRRIDRQRPSGRDDIRDPFDREAFQAPSFGPLAWRSTGSRRPWTHAVVGGTGGRGGADQATSLWPLRSRLGAYLALPTVPDAQRSRVARTGTAQRLWSHRASLGGSVVGRLSAEQAQHRDAVVRRLRRRPGAWFGLSAGAACVGRRLPHR